MEIVSYWICEIALLVSGFIYVHTIEPREISRKRMWIDVVIYVVFLGAVEFVDSQLGLDPVKAVFAFGIADAGGYIGAVVAEGKVIHPVNVPVPEEVMIGAAVAFPHLIVDNDPLLPNGMMDTVGGGGQFGIQQKIIKKAFFSL